MRTIYRDIVVGLVISKDNKVLFGMKDPKGGGVYADCWHTPGGGIEEGETQLAALKREMHEELGIDINDADITIFDNEGTGESNKILAGGEKVLCKMKFYVYKIAFNKNANTIRITAGDDIEKTIRADLSNLKSIKLTPPSVDLFIKHKLL